jgi:hypothetical protein
VAVEQPNDTVVLLSVDQLLSVIRELPACYETAASGKSRRESKSNEEPLLRF